LASRYSLAPVSGGMENSTVACGVGLGVPPADVAASCSVR
jgi:hypothetical protein